MIPEAAQSEVFWEHVYRYRFATAFAPERDVVDIACGEGYGSASLALAGARSVVGIDIDPSAVRHATLRYSGRPNLTFRAGDAVRIPAEDRSADVLISFETVEHVPDPAAFLSECRRVLRPDGWLVMSTPDVGVYNPGGDPTRNPFHCSELSPAEFTELIGRFFGPLRLYSQRRTRAWFFSPLVFQVYPCPWLGHTGVGRIGQWVQRWSRVNRPGVEARLRSRTEEAICGPDEGWIARSVNPFRVRPGTSGRPMYLIAVARG
jgi:2-polyprenyl-3-methyl-5-hydroxy-6-metoxy-1,4-benzoquinol methylase